MRNFNAAKYNTNVISDSSSINVIKNIIDKNRVFSYQIENDKTPNYDGYLELIQDGNPIGKLVSTS